MATAKKGTTKSERAAARRRAARSENRGDGAAKVTKSAREHSDTPAKGGKRAMREALEQAVAARVDETDPSTAKSRLSSGRTTATRDGTQVVAYRERAGGSKKSMEPRKVVALRTGYDGIRRWREGAVFMMRPVGMKDGKPVFPRWVAEYKDKAERVPRAANMMDEQEHDIEEVEEERETSSRRAAALADDEGDDDNSDLYDADEDEENEDEDDEDEVL